MALDSIAMSWRFSNIIISLLATGVSIREKKVIDVHRSMEIPTSTAEPLDHITVSNRQKRQPTCQESRKYFSYFSTCFSSELSTTPPPPPTNGANRVSNRVVSVSPSLAQLEHVLNRSISCTRTTVARRTWCRLVWPLASFVIVIIGSLLFVGGSASSASSPSSSLSSSSTRVSHHPASFDVCLSLGQK